MGTLAKVAVGMAVAKGVKSLAGGGGRGSSGGGLGDLLGQLGGGSSRSAQSGGGGLGDLLGQLGGASGGGRQAKSGGGLGDLLGQLGGVAGGSSSQSGGGLGGLLGQLTGGGSSSAGGGTGLENIMGGVFKNAQGSGGVGGLGGMLDSLSGSGARAGTGAGGIGDMLNQSFDRFGEPEATPTQEQDETAGVMLKAMLQAAKSDGRIDANEKEALMKNLGDASAEEMAFVNAVMDAPVDAKGLAREVPSGAEAQTYMMSLIACDLDSDAEAQYLNSFAVALGLEERQVNQIHQQMGEPPLYG
jgi:uncharacterized membrane protein YebE (DUF533 family)